MRHEIDFDTVKLHLVGTIQEEFETRGLRLVRHSLKCLERGDSAGASRARAQLQRLNHERDLSVVWVTRFLQPWYESVLLARGAA
jgi:hypothetical protein